MTVHQISSRQNPFFKELSRCARAAGGARAEQLLLEGMNLCLSWLEHRGAPDALIIDETSQSLPEIRQLQAQLSHVPCYQLSSTLFRRLSDVVSPQGVMFWVRKPVPELPAQIRQTCLILDRIQDPGNLGTMLRTAAALGIEQIFLTPGTVSAWSPKVLRSAQGAHFLVTLHEQMDRSECLQRLRIPLAVTVPDGDETLFGSRLTGPIAWVFGNEGQGVDPAWRADADYRIAIEHLPQIESLNVAVAAAVCLFEHHRQLLNGDSGD